MMDTGTGRSESYKLHRNVPNNKFLRFYFLSHCVGGRISGRTPTSNALLPYHTMVMQRVHRDTRFILVPTSRSYVQQYASRAMYLAPKDACRGGLQAGWERERGSQVPARTD